MMTEQWLPLYGLKGQCSPAKQSDLDVQTGMENVDMAVHNTPQSIPQG